MTILNQNKLWTLVFGMLAFIGCGQQASSPIAWEEKSVDFIAENQGLAGALIGSSGNFIVLSGGANFPDRLPWEGGLNNTMPMYIYSP